MDVYRMFIWWQTDVGKYVKNALYINLELINLPGKNPA